VPAVTGTAEGGRPAVFSIFPPWEYNREERTVTGTMKGEVLDVNDFA
jgi:hypothetical protein